MQYMFEGFPSFSLATLMVIIGPLLLLGALIYGVSVAGRRRRSQRAAADRATREDYRDEENTKSA